MYLFKSQRDSLKSSQFFLVNSPEMKMKKKIVYINLHINNGTSCLSVVRFMSSTKPNIYHRHRSDVLTESRHSSGKLVAQFNLNVGRGCYFRCI